MPSPIKYLQFISGHTSGLTSGHNSVSVQCWTHVYMNSFDHKDPGNHLLQLYPELIKHPVCMSVY